LASIFSVSQFNLSDDKAIWGNRYWIASTYRSHLVKPSLKIEEFGSFFSSALQAWKLAAQRFAYGLWRFRSTFLSPKTKAGYGAKALLSAVHPP
jgi:hypothetical protein